jgi:hypothetical protein
VADAKAIISLGRLRLLRLRAGRQAEPDARDAGAQGDHRQADHQGAGLPADRRSDDRRRHLHADLRPHSRTRPPGPAEDVLRPAHPRQVLSPPHFDAGQFVEAWDDEGAQGLLPLQDGLQGPDHLQRLLHDALERWRVSWPMQSGHGCIGCSEDGFWDKGSFYDRVTDITQFGVEANADTIGKAPPARSAARLPRMPP